MGFGDGGDDAGNEFVLEFEDGFGIESAIVGFGPEVSAGGSVDELHGETQPGSCLAQAALHYVARAEFFAGGADVA